MKNLITLLLFVLLLISANSYSQTTTRKYEYSMVQMDGANDEIIIYYGNQRSENFAELKNIKLENTIGKNRNYIVDALNYMDEQGYELVHLTLTHPEHLLLSIIFSDGK